MAKQDVISAGVQSIQGALVAAKIAQVQASFDAIKALFPSA